jgi:3-hydroxyisobutyrate dehydrogenase-like beta-hydroxyacid dehydrogenase
MTTLALCGLGQMGGALANRLLEGGHELIVWNRTAERAGALVERGARAAATPAEAARSADAVVTMLATPAALEQVVFGADGLTTGLAPGSTLIEMSTVGPDAVRALAARLPEGVHLLDAPVLGSVPQATQGTLELFVGGPEDVFERWRPVLELLGRPVHFGPVGAGAAMKLVANLTLGVLMTGLGEALALADAEGLDQALVLDALAGSPIGATVKSKRDNVESGTYPPNFKLSLAVKDLRLVTEAAARAGLDLCVAPAARAWLEMADEAGLGPRDYSAVIAHVRRREAAGARSRGS